MNKVILSISITLALVLGASSVSAQSYQQTKTCDHISTIAENVMLMYQLGASKYMIKSRLIDSSTNSTVASIVKTIVDDAFSHPRYSSESDRNFLSRKFAEDKHRQCLIAMGEVS